MYRAHAILMLFFVVVPMSYVVDAHAFQEHQLFDYTDLESGIIRNRHKVEEVLSHARSAPTTKRIYLINFNVDLLDSPNTTAHESSDEERISSVTVTGETPVYVYTPFGRRIEFDRFSTTRKSSSQYHVFGSHTQSPHGDYFSLSVSNGRVLGNIQLGNESYFIGSLGDNVHVLMHLDTSKFKNEGPSDCVLCGE